MKLKHQLAVFNVFTRLLLLLVLVLFLPFLVENIIYRHTDKILSEKKEKFIEHLGDREINAFLNESKSSDTYASFSKLHGEFIMLSKLSGIPVSEQSVFVNDERDIENQIEEYRILQFTFRYKNSGYQLEVGNSLSEIKDLTFALRLFSIVLLIVVSLVTFLTEALYIEYLLTPFNKIINTKIKRAHEPEQFDATPIPSHSEEIRELDTVINQMMARIKESFQKEKNFISNVSHELLTPLSVLKSRMENLLQSTSLNETELGKVAESLKTIDLLKRIIHNLLLISKIENNQYPLNEAVTLEKLLDEVLESLQDRIELSRIKIGKDLNGEFVFRGNRTLIHIMLFNVLSNAVKYNRKGGQINISVYNEKGTHILRIQDTGKGIAAVQQKEIFKRFSRASTEQEGQGLGLAIVETIAKCHTIAIELTSEENQGTIFTFVFPDQLLL